MAFFLGTAGNDTVVGTPGDDAFYGSAGADIIKGGAGVDTVIYEFSPRGVRVNLGAGTASGGDAEGDTLIAIENVFGSRYRDWLVGDNGDNTLNGNYGNDVLDGQDGDDYLNGSMDDDVLFGGFGNDTLEGGPQNDTLSGGKGEDTFVFIAPGGEGNDVITDFQVGVDMLMFRASDDLQFNQVGSDTIITFEGTPGEITLENVSLALLSAHAEHDLLFI
jgi:Ca2+-binding RTX toxin-like protein